jgi:hypothetical protein
MRYFLVDGEDIKTNEPIEVIYNNRNFNMQIDKSPFLGIGTKKNGRLLTSHRYNRLPLLPSDPGGVQQELVV